MIWTQAPAPATGYLHAGFRKEFELRAAPASATFRSSPICATSFSSTANISLAVPNRFENAHPEFDTFNVASKLHAGKNVLSVLVHRDVPSGRVQQHAPGLALRLNAQQPDGTTLALATDPTWQAFPTLPTAPSPPSGPPSRKPATHASWMATGPPPILTPPPSPRLSS